MSKDIGNVIELPQQLSAGSSNSNSKSGSVQVSSVNLLGSESRSPSRPSSNEPKTSTRPTSKSKTDTSKSKVNKTKNYNDKKVLKKYFCPVCSQGFTRKHNMVSHELIHSSLKPHICTVCNSKFRRIHDLKRHEKLHTGEKPYVCDRCSRSFARPDALTRHKNSQDACSAVKSENEAQATAGNPALSDPSASDSNTPMSLLEGSGGNDRPREHSHTTTHTYRQPYTTTTTTTTTTTRRYEDSRLGNQNESHSQNLPPLNSMGDRSRQTQLPPYSLILGNTQSEQNHTASSWQLPLQNVSHQHHHHHHHPPPERSSHTNQWNLPIDDPTHGDMNYSRSIHHQPLILNDAQRQPMELQSQSKNQSKRKNQNQNQNFSANQSTNQNINQILNQEPNRNNFKLSVNLGVNLGLNMSLNMSLNVSLNMNLARDWPSSNVLGPLLHSNTTPVYQAQDLEQIPGYPYLHQQTNNQSQQEEPKNYVTLAKYQDLVNYAQSLQDSMSKMNVRLKLLEGQRDLPNQLDKPAQGDRHSD